VGLKLILFASKIKGCPGGTEHIIWTCERHDSQEYG